MDNRDFSNIGEQVSRMVDDAMRSMNFSKLNQDISRTVNQALDEARRQFGGYSDTDFLPHVDPHSKYDRESQSEGQRQQQNGSGQRPFGQGFRSTETVQPGAGKREQRSVTEIKVQPVGKVSGILMIVFGSIGLGFAGVMELILLVASLFTGRLNLLGISLVVQIPILIFALALLWERNRQPKRLQKDVALYGDLEWQSVLSDRRDGSKDEPLRERDAKRVKEDDPARSISAGPH